MLLVAILTVPRAKLAEFRAYESQAARIMERFGGRIERALELAGEPGPTLRELHIVAFPDAEAYAGYRSDPALAALRPLREACVLATEIWDATEGPRYGSAA